MCNEECKHDCQMCRREEGRKRINKLLLNIGKYPQDSMQYEILRRELVRELDEYDNE